MLGNVGDPTDPRVAATLAAALAVGDPLVRAHAVWAARRLGRDDLVLAAGVATERRSAGARRARRAGRPAGERSERLPPVTHLLVTNDFPPKVGGIQSYLWELWRRLDPASFTVLTTPYEGAEAWDAEQAFRVVRTRSRVLLPSRPRRAEVAPAHVGGDRAARPAGRRAPR